MPLRRRFHFGANSDAHASLDAHTDSDAHAKLDAYADSDAHAKLDAYANSDAAVFHHTYANSHAHPDSDTAQRLGATGGYAPNAEVWGRPTDTVTHRVVVTIHRPKDVARWRSA